MRVGICQRVTALVITAALLAITAGITFAAIPDASGVFHACMLKGAGTLRIIDPALPRSDLRSHCTAFETEITWGSRGTTVTAIPVPSGNAFCPAGGTQFTVGTIVTYACNGTAGTNGAAGSVAGLAGTPCVTQAGAAGTLSVATGEGDYILLRCGTAVQPPAVAVSNVTAFAIASNLMILHWDPVPSATSYQVFRSTTTGAGYVPVGMGDDKGFTDFAVSPNTSYFYVVQASNSAGAGAVSVEVAATTSSAPPFGLLAGGGTSFMCSAEIVQIEFLPSPDATIAFYTVGVGGTTNGSYTTASESSVTSSGLIAATLPRPDASSFQYFIVAAEASGRAKVVQTGANVACGG